VIKSETEIRFFQKIGFLGIKEKPSLYSGTILSYVGRVSFFCKAKKSNLTYMTYYVSVIKSEKEIRFFEKIGFLGIKIRLFRQSVVLNLRSKKPCFTKNPI
jgi:hypothetical protein